ncbi:MAG TPA: acylphosphatase, partial [Sphingomicrobium sp.]|nr:acylphosphatase [Sphingomicrobium sp.]
YRTWTQQQARGLGVSGWIRNCYDGSVEAHVEGDEAAVKALIGRMHDGPPAAEVENVQVEDAASEGAGGFEVRH